MQSMQWKIKYQSKIKKISTNIEQLYELVQNIVSNFKEYFVSRRNNLWRVVDIGITLPRGEERWYGIWYLTIFWLWYGVLIKFCSIFGISATARGWNNVFSWKKLPVRRTLRWNQQDFDNLKPCTPLYQLTAMNFKTKCHRQIYECLL